MKAVNVDDVLKILYKYGKFLFITDYPNYRKMQDEIANLPKVTDNTGDTLDKIRDEIEEYRDSMQCNNESLVKWEAINYILENIIDKYKAKDEDKK